MSSEDKANTLIKINIRGLLEFFDVKVPESRRHATAIVAVCGEELGAGLFKHYWESKGKRVEIFSCPCTQGTRKGKRLDFWIKVGWRGRAILYQTEIKNWSAHAIGGKKLDLDATARTIAEYKVERWRALWDEGNKDFTLGTRRHLGKVLVQMRCPREYGNNKVKPLVCLWTALHPHGGPACFFKRRLPEGQHFKNVWFFSMSAYLRTLLQRNQNQESIQIEMPNTVKRVQWLRKLMLIGDLQKL